MKETLQVYFKKNTSHILLLSTLIFIAFFVRILWINTIPAGIYPDEAMNGVDALTAWQEKDFQLFYENNNGREGLFINLIALSTAILGNTVLGLKIWSILFGTLTVLGVYLLGKELFSSKRLGLYAAFLMTFSYWAVNFSRISFRAIFLPLILTFSFYFLFRGLRTKTFLPFALSGFIFGLGFHTYIAFRIAPAILIVLFIFLLLSKKDALKTYWKHGFVFLTCMFLSVFPMLYDFYSHPEHFSSRSSSISILSPEVNKGDFWGTLGETFTLSIAKYFTWGDQNWRHNIPPLPILDVFTSISFAAALLWAIRKFFLLLKERIQNKERNRELLVLSFLLGWFFLMLVPEFLTNESLPHALRAIGTQGSVFILAALPFLWISRIPPKRFFSPTLISTVILLFISLTNLFLYFAYWGTSQQSKDAFDSVFTQQALYIQSLKTSNPIYVLANGPGQTVSDGLPVSAEVIRYFTFFQKNVIFITHLEEEIQTPSFLIPMRYDDSLSSTLQNQFSQDVYKEVIESKDKSSSFTIFSLN